MFHSNVYGSKANENQFHLLDIVLPFQSVLEQQQFDIVVPA